MSREFADHVREMLTPLGPVTVRAMFGGFGIYLDGRMFGLIAGNTLFLRSDDGNRAAYEAAGMGPFKPWPDKPMTMPYHEAPPDLLENRDELCRWGREAHAAALRAPAKPKKASRGRSGG